MRSRQTSSQRNAGGVQRTAFRASFCNIDLFTLFAGRTSFTSILVKRKSQPTRVRLICQVLLRYRLLATHGSLAMRLQPLECSIWKCWPRRNESDGLRKVSKRKNLSKTVKKYKTTRYHISFHLCMLSPASYSFHMVLSFTRKIHF